MQKPFGGKIKKWEIHKLTTIPGAIFTGTVAEAGCRFKTGNHMRSSPIIRIRKNGGGLRG